jgi:uncharacterized RDD family membrane protein YckC
VSIVTPEAVRLDFEPAGVATRIMALVLDLFIQINAMSLVISLLSGSTASDGELSATAVIVTVVFTFVVLFGYPVLCETFWHGQTIGKMALGLRVRTREGSPERFRHAVIRAALGLVEIYATFGIPAMLSILFSRQHQRLGDLAAGTLVVRERTAAAKTGVAYDFFPPYGWDAYTDALDVGAMTNGQYGLVRNFLLRADEMSPGPRRHLATRLAEPLTGVLHHTPPGNVSPEQFLLCAAAAYQRQRSPSRLVA